MIGAKPIEAGCRAVIINDPFNNGTIVKVLCYVGTVMGYCDNNMWTVDKILRDYWEDNGSYAGEGNVQSEHCLMRLDNPEIQEQIEDELEAVV